MIKRRFLTILAVVVVCGITHQSVTAADSSTRAQPAALIVISDAPSEFMSKTVTVKVGDTVQWRNTGGIAHSVEFVGEKLPAGAGIPDSGVMSPGATYSYTFKQPVATHISVAST